MEKLHFIIRGTPMSNISIPFCFYQIMVVSLKFIFQSATKFPVTGFMPHRLLSI